MLALEPVDGGAIDRHSRRIHADDLDQVYGLAGVRGDHRTC